MWMIRRRKISIDGKSKRNHCYSRSPSHGKAYQSRVMNFRFHLKLAEGTFRRIFVGIHHVFRKISPNSVAEDWIKIYFVSRVPWRHSNVISEVIHFDCFRMWRGGFLINLNWRKGAVCSAVSLLRTKKMSGFFFNPSEIAWQRWGRRKFTLSVAR